MSHRWIKFWPADWKGDAALRMCGLAARGLWIECIAIMHEAEPYGHLMVNGKALNARQIAAVVGSTERDITRLLAELEAAGVFNRTPDGTIYSRRMVRDHDYAQRQRFFGKTGGNPALTLKGRDKAPDKAGLKPTLEGGDKFLEAEADTEEEKIPPTPRKRGAVVAVSIPAWLPADAWADWCAYRISQKKSGWTQGAATRCIAKLATLRDQGEDPRAVIDQSIAGGWTGLFGTKGRAQASAAPRRESNLTWMHGMFSEQPAAPSAFDFDLTAEELP